MFNRDDIQELITTIKLSTGYDFSEYSEKSFQRRIEKILEDYKISMQQLKQEIRKAEPKFIEKLIADITVNTTELFRNPVVWHSVKYRILSKLKTNEQINYMACRKFNRTRSLFYVNTT